MWVAGILLTRWYDQSRWAQDRMHWLWTMDQRPARRWHQ